VRAVVFAASGEPTVVVAPDGPREVSGYKTLVSCVSDESIASTTEALTTIKLTGDDFVAAGYSPYTDRIEIRTSLDGASLAERIAKSLVERDYTLIAAQAGGRADRRWDGTPHYAGSQINDGAGGYDCSSGFYVSGYYGPFALSAVHCPGNAFNNGNNTVFYGNVATRQFPNPDMLMMNGAAYTGRTYSEANQTSSAGISGAGDPGYNISYCNNGATSLETCSNMTSRSSTFCDAAGCTFDLAYHERACAWGVISQGGDSGGPVVRHLSNGKQRATGIVVASTQPTGGCTAGAVFGMWYTKWGTI
jgi:hypothetical protein